jgi:hypothetical protein
MILEVLRGPHKNRRNSGQRGHSQKLELCIERGDHGGSNGGKNISGENLF